MVNERRSWLDALLDLPRLALVIALLGLLPLLAYVLVPIASETEAGVSALLIGAGLLIAAFFPGYRMAAMVISLTATFRYLWWRTTQTVYLRDPADAVACLLLLGAELYGFLIILGGYFQTAIRRERAPIPFDLNSPRLPSVDIYVPTFDESVDILRTTLTGALAIDYPRKTVYLLDDGRRPEMAALAREMGCEYLTRPDNKGAKAGNLNHALTRTDGEFIAFFDADHVPVRTFLQVTLGFLLADDKVALVQTPQHFYNPDPYERNLLLEGRSPPEQAFFYHLIQKGNDFWNSSFFCGSCALIRRAALLDVGGIATETVTEDAHTAMKMHALGWQSVYLDIPQAAGLATQRFAFHVAQRTRWSRGMTQILRLDNPLFKSGLSLAQRFNYFIAANHFLFGIPRLIFILAPCVYLVLGIHPVFASARDIMVFALPHVWLAAMCAASTHRNVRHSFWPEVFETAIAPVTALVTTLAILAPRRGKFNVTPKSGTSSGYSFDWRNALPLLVLLAFNIAALVWAPRRLAGEPESWGTILIVVGWVCYNLVLLSAALAVCYERPQRRATVRVRVQAAVVVTSEPGSEDDTLGFGIRHEGLLENLSETGCSFYIRDVEALPGRIRVHIMTPSCTESSILAEPLELISGNDGEVEVRARFLDVDDATRHQLRLQMFTEPDVWMRDRYLNDNPLRAAWSVISAPWRVVGARLGFETAASTVRGPRLNEAWDIGRCIQCGRTSLGPVEVCTTCGGAIDRVEFQPPTTTASAYLPPLPLVVFAVSVLLIWGLGAAGFNPIRSIDASLGFYAFDEVREARTDAAGSRLAELGAAQRELRNLHWHAWAASRGLSSGLSSRWDKRLWWTGGTLPAKADIPADSPAPEVENDLKSAYLGLKAVAPRLRDGRNDPSAVAELDRVDLLLDDAATRIRAAQSGNKEVIR